MSRPRAANCPLCGNPCRRRKDFEELPAHWHCSGIIRRGPNDFIACPMLMTRSVGDWNILAARATELLRREPDLLATDRAYEALLVLAETGEWP